MSTTNAIIILRRIDTQRYNIPNDVNLLLRRNEMW